MDDAGITEPKTLQIESWYGASGGHQYAVVNPSYQPVPNLELSLQMTHDRQAGDRTDSVAPQAKYQWHRDDRTGGFDSVIEGGLTYDLDPARVPAIFLSVPVTWHVSPAFDAHVNVGAQYEVNGHRLDPILGVAGDYSLNAQWALRAETFRDMGSRIGFQVGPHVTLAPGIELDALYGWHVVPEDDRLFTVGVTLSL